MINRGARPDPLTVRGMFQVPNAELRRNAWQAAARAAYRRTPAGAIACRQGFVLTHVQARAVGLDNADLRRLVRRGEWTAPRRGVLCVLPRATGSSLVVHGFRPEILASAALLVRPGTVISHECAALAHGLDVLRTPAVATLSTSSRRDACARKDLIVRAVPLRPEEVRRWYGADLTSCARTVIDLARRGARDGIVVADSALRDEVVTIEELRAALPRQRGRDGVRTARRVLELASALSESALESLVRLFLADHHVPLPEQQRWIETYRGWYRVDGLWEQQRVILEVDGLAKYEGSRKSLTKEKLRQEALERAGYCVVRVTWSDIHGDPITTLARIWAALNRQR